MFLAIRLLVGVGLLITLGYTLSYLLRGDQHHLTIALRVLLASLLITVILALGIWLEHVAS